MTIQWATGFEHGNTDDIADGGRLTKVSATTSTAHTGSYSMKVDGDQLLNDGYWYINLPSPAAEMYFSYWVKLSHDSSCFYIRHYTDTGRSNEIELKYDAGTNTWDAYVGAGEVAAGTEAVTPTDWHHIQVYIKVADSGGRIVTKIDGVTDIDYTGDTKQGADTAVQVLEFYCYYPGGGNARYFYIDDLAVGTGDWLGDLRLEAIVPNGDDSAQFTGSDEDSVDNYALVDEVPAGDADYVYAETDAYKDVYTLSDWDGTDKVPVGAVSWVRGKKEGTGAHEALIGIDDGVEETYAKVLGASFDYHYHVFNDPPSGGDWDESVIDGLKAVIEANIL
jgi:hypothetical protein